MSSLLSKFASGLSPYVCGEQPKDKEYIKLNTNENPYGVPDSVIEAIKGEAGNLMRYPDPEVTDLRDAVAEFYNERLGLEGELKLDRKNIFIGNGSDEVLAFSFPAFFKGGLTAVSDISYSFYPVYASLFECDLYTVPLNKDYTVNVDAYLGALPPEVTAILICNPNAPTTIALGLDEIVKIIEANRDKVVVVDEAYVDFGAMTAAGLANKYENLVVVQTMSKSRSLAGMRVGMAIGAVPLIDGLRTIKNCFNSYSSDRLAIAAGTAAIKDTKWFDETRGKIIATRDRIRPELEKLGFFVPESKTNFYFASHGKMGAKELFDQLKDKGVLVRYFNKPGIDNFLRISVGTDDEMDRLVEILKEILG